MISMNQITSGTGLRINGSIVIVTEYQHVKPGKGGAFMRVKLKNIKTQQVMEKTFKTSDKLEDVVLEERKLQLLYQSGDSFHFMDTTSFEQMDIPKNVIGDDERFLKENQEVTGICYNDEVLKINLGCSKFIAQLNNIHARFNGLFCNFKELLIRINLRIKNQI